MPKKLLDINLQIPLATMPYVVLDVETTGLSPEKGDKIIDICLMRWDGQNVSEVFQTRVNPGRPVSPAASLVNGIYDSDLVGAPIFADIAGRVWKFLHGAILVAHNAPFDLKFINYELAGSGYEQWEGVLLCTLALARNVDRASNNKLASVAERFNYTPDGLHSAEGDVRTTHFIFQAYQKKLKAMQVQTLRQMIQAQGRWIIAPQASKRV